MEIEIAVPGDDGRALAEVLTVLQGHPAMRGIVVTPALSKTRPRDPQSGMSTFEVVNAVLSQGSGYGGLALGLYTAIRAARRPSTTPDTTSTTITATRAGTPVSVKIDRELTPAEIESHLRSLEGEQTPPPPPPGA